MPIVWEQLSKESSENYSNPLKTRIISKQKGLKQMREFISDALLIMITSRAWGKWISRGFGLPIIPTKLCIGIRSFNEGEF